MISPHTICYRFTITLHAVRFYKDIQFNLKKNRDQFRKQDSKKLEK